MLIAQVIGQVVSTAKHPYYKGKKILLVKQKKADGGLSDDTWVAVDTIGAGMGENVLVTQEGRAASEILATPTHPPIRTIIVGIVDKLEMEVA